MALSAYWLILITWFSAVQHTTALKKVIWLFIFGGELYLQCRHIAAVLPLALKEGSRFLYPWYKSTQGLVSYLGSAATQPDHARQLSSGKQGREGGREQGLKIYRQESRVPPQDPSQLGHRCFSKPCEAFPLTWLSFCPLVEVPGWVSAQRRAGWEHPSRVPSV